MSHLASEEMQTSTRNIRHHSREVIESRRRHSHSYFRSSRRPGLHERMIQKMTSLQDMIVSNGGCPRSVCFTVDGSPLLSETDRKLEQDFVALIAATLGVNSDVQVAAWQYGPRLQLISSLSSDIDTFLVDLEKWGHTSSYTTRSSNHNYLSFAMRRCDLSMLRRIHREGGASKMVVIGNGRASYGQKITANQAAELFRKRGGGVCSVAVKDADLKFFGEIAGSLDRVLSVTDYNRFETIFTQTVKQICDFH